MRKSIVVQNLRCGGCARTITTKLSEIQNVSDIKVDVNTATISFLVQNSEEGLEVKQKLKALGYPEVNNTNGVLLKVKSFMSCASGKIKTDL